MSAIISPCGLYRYRLEREVDPLLGDKTVAFIMVNPSTADATEDDATIRKVVGFARRMAARRVIVGNLFAYRATDIRALRTAVDPIGCSGGDHLRTIMRDADQVIVAWGPCAKLPHWLRNRWMEVAGIAEATGTTLWCLGTANDGHPLHPLMLGYDRAIVPWERPDSIRDRSPQGRDAQRLGSREPVPAGGCPVSSPLQSPAPSNPLQGED